MYQQFNKMITEYTLRGLSKPRSATLYKNDDINGETFKLPVNMDADRFDALFKYCFNNWDEKKIAVVEHDGFMQSGIPKNGRVIEIKI